MMMILLLEQVCFKQIFLADPDAVHFLLMQCYNELIIFFRIDTIKAVHLVFWCCFAYRLLPGYQSNAMPKFLCHFLPGFSHLIIHNLKLKIEAQEKMACSQGNLAISKLCKLDAINQMRHGL